MHLHANIRPTTHTPRKGSASQTEEHTVVDRNTVPKVPPKCGWIHTVHAGQSGGLRCAGSQPLSSDGGAACFAWRHPTSEDIPRPPPTARPLHKRSGIFRLETCMAGRGDPLLRSRPGRPTPPARDHAHAHQAVIGRLRAGPILDWLTGRASDSIEAWGQLQPARLSSHPNPPKRPLTPPTPLPSPPPIRHPPRVPCLVTPTHSLTLTHSRPPAELLFRRRASSLASARPSLWPSV